VSPIADLTAAAAIGVLAGLLLAVLPLRRLNRALRTARHQAHHDDTTALPNRRAFLSAVDDTRRTGRAFGLVLLDLDGFKQINDRHGHEAGNDLLTTVGQRLADLPSPVRLAARLSGDEFALLVHGGPDDTDRAAQLAAAVTAAAPVTLHGGVAETVTASVGYTTSRPGVTTRALLREADEAMYRAKRGTGPICRHEPATAATEVQPGRCRDRR
jgi:diguanylate cyclase (GGDEF)-like protein